MKLGINLFPIKAMTIDQVILITGAREWSDKDTICVALEPYKGKRVLLIHGDCHGADKLAGSVAEELKFDVNCAPADWKTYGRSAGPIRNLEMIKEAKSYKEDGISTVVIAFHDCLEESKGTKHCVEQARKAGLEVIIYKSSKNKG